MFITSLLNVLTDLLDLHTKLVRISEKVGRAFLKVSSVSINNSLGVHVKLNRFA